jgi:hypothetical protein
MALDLSRHQALLLLLLHGQLRVLRLQVPMLPLSCHLPGLLRKSAQQQQQQPLRSPEVNVHPQALVTDNRSLIGALQAEAQHAAAALFAAGRGCCCCSFGCTAS